MCGIAGWVSKKPVVDSEKTIQRMCSCIANRGPDSQGYVLLEPCAPLNQQIALGHTRLSIVDLTSSGYQPMVDHTGKYYIVFNGEIYNHKEIRQKLAFFDIPYRGTSDTEVLLYSYIHYGEGCLDLFNGMFAFAIVDTEKGEVFLARDRMGVKPLYYFESQDSFAFSSDPSALYCYMGQYLELQPDALAEYLSYGYIGQSRSILKNVRKLAPGTTLNVSSRGIYNKKFWELQTDKIRVMESVECENADVAIQSIKLLLEDSVRLRLEADVPVGVFLSGGIDSSLVTAAATKVGSNIKTFTIGFSEKTFDESAYAEDIAKYLKTDHRTLIIGEQDFLDTIDLYSDTYTEPLSDPSGIAVLLLSKFTREHVKVALSGDGGDEQFFGYATYLHYKKLQKIYRMPVALRKIIGQFLMYGTQNFDKHQKALSIMYKDFRSCMEFFVNLLQGSKLSGNLPVIERELHGNGLCNENEWMLTDFQNYMINDVLVKVDRASMRFGLEVRNPLLDYRFVENSFYNIPLLLKRNSPKYLLKKLLEQYLPIELFNRPKKGFSIPLQKWVNRDLKSKIQESLQQRSVLNSFLDQKKLINLSNNPDFCETKYGSILLWRIYLFNMWEKRYFSNV